MGRFDVRFLTLVLIGGAAAGTMMCAPSAQAQNVQPKGATEKSIIIVGGHGAEGQKSPTDKPGTVSPEVNKLAPSAVPNSAQTKALNPQPLPPKEVNKVGPSIVSNPAQTKALNPQPLPPKEVGSNQPR